MKVPECKKHRNIKGRKLIELNVFKNQFGDLYTEYVMQCGCSIQRKLRIIYGTKGIRSLTKQNKIQELED